MKNEVRDVPRVLSRREVAMVLDVSLTTLWRLVRDGHFPQPIRVSPGRVGWTATTVGGWLEAREAASRGRGSEGETGERTVQVAPTDAPRR